MPQDINPEVYLFRLMLLPHNGQYLGATSRHQPYNVQTCYKFLSPHSICPSELAFA